MERLLDNPSHEDPMDDSPSDPHMLDSTAKDVSVLADIYWVPIFSYQLAFMLL